MPGLCLHRVLAVELLSASGLVASGLELQRAENWERFLAGSAGPDMGVFPGGAALLSDLAHYERAGDLARAIVAEARSAEERAYAWGWAAHCLADQILHPLVNRGVGELLAGDFAREIPYGDNPCAHVRVELGLDAYWIARVPPAQQISSPTNMNADFMARAFAAIYGIDVHQRLKASLQAVQRWTGTWIKLARTHAARHGWQEPARGRGGALVAELLLTPGRIATLGCQANSGLRGLFRAVPPSPRLLGECRPLMNRFLEEFQTQFAAATPTLPNCNLDTGYCDDPAAPYPLAAVTRDRWQRELTCATLPKRPRRQE